MTSNYYSACTSLLAFLHQIGIRQTLLLVRFAKLISQSIISDTARVYNRVRWQNILDISSYFSILSKFLLKLIHSPQLPVQHFVQHLQQHTWSGNSSEGHHSYNEIKVNWRESIAYNEHTSQLDRRLRELHHLLLTCIFWVAPRRLLPACRARGFPSRTEGRFVPWCTGRKETGRVYKSVEVENKSRPSGWWTCSGILSRWARASGSGFNLKWGN